MPVRSAFVRSLPWLGLLALILIEWNLFSHFARREFAWVYPFRCDQAFYLGQSYTVYEDIQQRGLGQSITKAFESATPQGILFGIQGGLLFFLLGAGRMSALTINFLYFALFQVTLFSTLRRLTARTSAAFFGVGLALLLHAPFMQFGASVDYRIDFSAFCLYGIVLCLVLRSGMFESWRWSLLVGGVTGWMILYRFLMSAYVFGVFGLVFAFILARRFTSGRSDADVRLRTQRQVVGWLMAVSTLCALSVPVLWMKRDQIYNYYVVGHISGAEKEFRAVYAHIQDAVDLFGFYPKVLVAEHLGRRFCAAALFFLGTGFLAYVIRGRRIPGPVGNSFDGKTACVFLMAAFLVPYLLLTLDISKSNIVANVLVPSVLLGVLLPVLFFWRAAAESPGPVLKHGLTLMALLAVSGGLFTQRQATRQHSMFRENRFHYDQIGVFYDVMADYLAAHHKTSATVSFNCMEADFFNPVVIEPFVYERRKLLVQARSAPMGSTFFELSEADAVKSVDQSDLVILSNPWKYPSFLSYYPVDACLKKLYPKLKDYCDQKLTPLAHVQVYEYDTILYARP